MEDVEVLVEVKVNLTESEEKVKKAVENVFGDIDTERNSLRKGSLLTSEIRGPEALTKFRNLLRRERIRNAARAVLFKGLKGKSIGFCLNKQVAYASHISFCEEMRESPLGAIKVRIQCENPRELIRWLTSKTLQDVQR